MALTVTGFSAATLDYKIVHQSAASGTMDGNVTGASGKLFYLTCTNGDSGNAVYLKVTTAASSVVADTPAIKIRISASTTETIVMPDGLRFTELSFYLTTVQANGVTQTNPGGTSTITAITS